MRAEDKARLLDVVAPALGLGLGVGNGYGMAKIEALTLSRKVASLPPPTTYQRVIEWGNGAGAVLPGVLGAHVLLRPISDSFGLTVLGSQGALLARAAHTEMKIREQRGAA